MKKIFKSVLRDLWKHRSRSYISFFAIFLVVSFPIAMFSTAPSLEKSLSEDSERYRLCHLDIRFHNTTEAVIPLINDTIIEVTERPPEFIEARVIARRQIRQNNDSYQANIVGYNPDKSLEINQLKLISGRMPSKENETVLLSSFAEEMGLGIDDNLTLSGKWVLKIVGLVESIEFLSYYLEQNGVLFVYEPTLRKILNIPESIYNSIVIYFWEEVSGDVLTSVSEELRKTLEEAGAPIIFFWHVREISVSAVFQDAINLTSKYLNASAIIIMLVSGVVIYIITKRYAFEQRKQTGTLYAFGFSSTLIYQTFLLRSTILSILGIGLGFFTSKYFLTLLTNLLGRRWGVLTVLNERSVLISVEVCISVFAVVLFFTYLAARSNVKMTPYEALRGKPSEFGSRFYKQKHEILDLPWNVKYALRNLLRNPSRSFFTIVAFLGAILLSFSLVSAQTSIYGSIDSYYEHQIQWDLQVRFNDMLVSEEQLSFIDHHSISKVEPYFEGYGQPIDYPEMLVILRGIRSNSILLKIDLQEGSLINSSESMQCVLSQYIAKRLNLKIGDRFDFWIGTHRINCTIVGLSRDMDVAASLFLFLEDLEQELGYMPINSALVQIKDNDVDETNTYLMKQPQIENVRTKSYGHNRIKQLVSNQTLIVQVMIILGFIVSSIIIFTTSFITAIERQREIALQKTFGFSNKQLLGQLMIEILFLTIIAIILGIGFGHLLTVYWNSIVSEFFFRIDLYFNIWDYLLTIGLCIISGIVSTYPGFHLIQSQKLAEAIREE